MQHPRPTPPKGPFTHTHAARCRAALVKHKKRFTSAACERPVTHTCISRGARWRCGPVSNYFNHLWYKIQHMQLQCGKSTEHTCDVNCRLRESAEMTIAKRFPVQRPVDEPPTNTQHYYISDRAALTGKYDTLVRRTPGWQGAPTASRQKN